nr:AUGMIN subunit 8 [Ipomoea batatas]
MENSQPQEKNNGINPRRHLTREFGSRFRSNFLAARHSPSQNVGQPETTSLEKKALSDDKTQPKTPPSVQVSEALWPSRRHGSESDISQYSSKPDHALRPSTNVVQKQTETLRKPAPETKRSLLKGENSADETENSRPVNSLNSQLQDEHALPSTTGGKPPSDSITKATKPPQESSNDLLPFGKNEKPRSRPVSPTKAATQSVAENSRSLNNLHTQLLDRWHAGRTVRKVTSDSLSRGTGTIDRNGGLANPLQKSPSDMLSVLPPSEGVKGGFKFHSVDDNSVSIERAVSHPTTPYKESTASASSISKNPSSVDSLNSQLLDQCRWPSTAGEKTSSNSENKNTDLGKSQGSRAQSSQRLSLDGSTKLLLHESSSDLQSLLPSSKIERGGHKFHSLDDNLWSLQRVRTSVVNHDSRPHPTSPSKPSAPFFSKVRPSGTKATASAATAHFPGSVAPSKRRLSLDGGTNLLQISSRDLKLQLGSDRSRKGGYEFHSVDDNPLSTQRISDSASRLISQSKPSAPSSESRGVSPSRTNTIASTTSLFWGLEAPSSRRSSLDGGTTKFIQNSSREVLSLEGEKPGFGSHSIDLLPKQREKTSLVNPETRSHPTSPNRASTLSSSLHIGVIPSQTKTIIRGTLQRLPFDGATKTVQNSSGNMLSTMSNEHTEGGLGLHSVDDNSPTVETKRTPIVKPFGSRPTSPKKAPALSSSVSGVVNPSKAKVTSLFLGSKVPQKRRLSLDGATIPLQKPTNDTLSLLTSADIAKGSFEFRSVDDNSLLLRREKTPLVNPISKSRPTSPNKASALYFSLSRVSPSQAKAIPTAPPRRASPIKVRPSSPTRLTNSGFSFVADNRENDASQIEDAHQLRILHNRHLQWRYANAQANVAIHAEEVNTKEMAYNVWKTTSNLWGTLIEMRIELQQLRQELKLYSVLNKQLSCLDKWSSIERNHIASVSRASQDMKTCVLLLPLMTGARGDTGAIKSSVCSAVGMIQYFESSLFSMLSQDLRDEPGEWGWVFFSLWLQLEGTTILVSKLAGVVAQERLLLDEFELLMAPTADMQVEEFSLRSHLMQLGTILQKR